MVFTTIDQSIFRTYDVRGIYPQNLTPEVTFAIGFAYSKMLSQDNPAIVVGYDGRHSSPILAQALMSGMQLAGARVTNIGCGPTPMLYFASHHFNADAAVMLTGSHNPPAHNGCKFVCQQQPFFAEQITALGQQAALVDAQFTVSTFEPIAVIDDYIAKLLASIPKLTKPLKVAWDPGNGGGGEVVSRLVTKLPGEHVVINGAIDGDFPAHHPDPSEAKNMRQLQQLVQEGGFDLGFAFDGDADRLGVVDQNGNIIAMDKLIAWYAKGMQDAQVLVDVKVSDQVIATMHSSGAQVEQWKTGHSHLKARMRDTGAKFAGEMSGHLFFKDQYYGFDDGIYAALRVLAGLEQGLPELGVWVQSFPPTFDTGEIRLDCPGIDRFALITQLGKWCYQHQLTYLDLDGVRVSGPTGWWLIRASNTQEALSIRSEAFSEHDFSLQNSLIHQALNSCGLSATVTWFA